MEGPTSSERLGYLSMEQRRNPGSFQQMPLGLGTNLFSRPLRVTCAWGGLELCQPRGGTCQPRGGAVSRARTEQPRCPLPTPPEQWQSALLSIMLWVGNQALRHFSTGQVSPSTSWSCFPDLSGYRASATRLGWAVMPRPR